MLLVWDLGISILISVLVPLVALFVRRKWSLAARRREEIKRLVIQASEEAANAELEASVPVSVSSGFHCPVCYCPAKTRCSRCKAVRYCSGKCQIIHWRQGHKDECRPACIKDDQDEADISGSSFSGFSSSPRNDSDDEISLCSSDAHSEDDAPSKPPLSPKFVHLVESVDNLSNIPENLIQSHSADPSDFWGMTLGSPERVSEDFSSAVKQVSQGTGNSSHVPSPLHSPSSESRSMLVPLKGGEVQLLASQASKPNECADAKSLDHQKQSGVAFHRINGKSGLLLKVVDQWTTPKSSAENEMPGIHGHKGIFPYEFFAKLHMDKIESQPCGLINCGNSCFANVIFQCLMFTPPLTTYFLQQFHSRACPNKEQCFTCGFENLVLKAREGTSPLSPNKLLSQLQNIGIFLGNGKEEDAHEFLRFVVDTMQSVSIKASEYDMLTTRKLEDTTLIGLTFGGYLRSKIKCMKCQGKSERREKMMDLTVEIDGDISTLDDALRRFTRTEILDGENKYRCGRCKSYERAKKKLKITVPPNVLTIALKRFQSGKFGKLNKVIRFPETLNLAPYVSRGSEKSHDYKLYGVIVHLDIMNASFSGHYVCYIRNSQNKWYKADDSMVVTCEIERVLTKRAYMLFYARCSPMPPRLVCTKTEALNKKSSVPVPKTNEKSISSMSGFVSSTPSAMWSFNTPGGGSSGNIQSFYSSFQRLQRILQDDSSSSDSSSLFDSNSDECSCSTDSTSMDDFADFIFGDHQGRAHGQPEAASPTSSSSSSPLLKRNLPLGDSARSSPTSRSHWHEKTLLKGNDGFFLSTASTKSK